MSAKPTPGPWLRDGLTIYALHHDGEYRKGVPTLVNRFSAHVEPCLYQGGPEAEAEANARLIAAAPDLLAVLVSVERFITETENPEDVWWTVKRRMVALGPQVRAAIAKAKGVTT